MSAASAEEAAGRLRQWAVALCATDSGGEQVAAVLGLYGARSPAATAPLTSRLLGTPG